MGQENGRSSTNLRRWPAGYVPCRPRRFGKIGQLIDQASCHVPSKVRVALQIGQVAFPPAFVGTGMASANADCERRAIVHREAIQMIVVDNNDEIGLRRR